MSEPDDRDLSAAFEELRAPASTAGYATRTTGLEIRTTGSRWPQALATTLAVLVAVAGAGTFLALRNARQGGAPSSSTGAPPARTGAAMAYDFTAAVTVMFGGFASSGKALNDTWTWNGSSWSSAAGGPGSLVGVRMVDDPADGGVLLVGMPPVPATSGGGSSGSGCAVGSSTGAASGGASSGVPGRTPVRPTGPPLSDPLPTAVAIPPVATCVPTLSAPPAPAAPVEQTWLFSGGGWKRVATGSSATSPPGGLELAYDSTTRQVVAVPPSAYACSPPLEAPTNDNIACPALGTSTGAPQPAVNCGVLLGCLTNGSIPTWTWSHGSWSRAPANSTVQRSGITLLFTDPATQHATLMTQYGVGLNDGSYACPGGGTTVKAVPCPPPPTPLVTTWTWTGTAWKQVSQVGLPQATPSLAGATVAAVGGHIVVLTVAGQTWTWAAGQWTQDDFSTTPGIRDGAAMAEGPAGTVVLFGGSAFSGVTSSSGARSTGSDTWLWDGKAWRKVGGTAPSPPPSPSFSCGPVPKAVGNAVAPPPCVQPLPVQVPPATPAATPTH